MNATELEEWRNEIELTESDSILFHLVPETMEYESGVAVDFYDEIGNQIISTYKSGEDILEHIQNIRVIEVTYES